MNLLSVDAYVWIFALSEFRTEEVILPFPLCCLVLLELQRMVDAAKNLESDLPPIPTTIEGSFSGDDLNNISDLDATFASSCFLGEQGATSNAQQGISVACMLLAGDSGGTESDATPA